MPTIRPATPADSPTCERILRALPDWFGIEESLVQYVADTRRYDTFLASIGASDAGFATLRTHFPSCVEVHCMAVAPEFHRAGIGRALIEHATAYCRAHGVPYLQVKTLGPSRPDEHYARTRAFYEAVGFIPIEEFPTLWGRNPALMLIMSIPLSSLCPMPHHLAPTPPS